MRIIYVFLFVCIVSSCFSQTPDSVSRDTTSQEQKIFYSVDQVAKFPGGNEFMMRFINENLVYPKHALKVGFEGKVFVRFIVDIDGLISKIEVLKGSSVEVNQEAVRIVSLFPKWIPAEKNGEPVKSQFVIPISFRLP